MEKIYKRHCDSCNQYYEGRGKYFCSNGCKGTLISKLKKGNKYWLGKKHTESTKNKMKKINIGKKNPMFGKKASEKTKALMSDAHKGLNNWSKGRKLTEEHKRKIGDAQSKEKCRLWRGGVSFEPYSLDWTEILRVAIRQRDEYLCRLCGHNGYHVHHIDYNKKNCCPENLITLCNKCHSKTNYKRDYWLKYFNNL